jgi:hypothetical protein
MKRHLILLVILLIPIAIITSSCKKDCGCGDNLATNKTAYPDLGDCVDNSKCNYPPKAEHKISFYASTSQYYVGSSLYNVTNVKVFVNGASIGTTSAWYPSGPGNCICPGTVPYSIDGNGVSVAWYSNVTLSNGTVLIGSGTIYLGDSSDCTSCDVCP